MNYLGCKTKTSVIKPHQQIVKHRRENLSLEDKVEEMDSSIKENVRSKNLGSKYSGKSRTLGKEQT